MSAGWRSRLKSWVEEHGGWLSPKVAVRSRSGRGHGLVLTADVEPGETLVSLPRDVMLLGDEAARQVPCRKKIAKYFAASGMAPAEQRRTQGVFSIMVLLLEEIANPAAKLAPYLSYLQQHWTQKAQSRFPLFWDDHQRAELRGTTALETFEAAAAGVAREFQLFQQLCPKVAARHTLEEYRRIWCLVNSRVLTYPGDPDEGTEPQSALLPVFDLVNHFLPPPASRLRLQQDVEGHYQHSRGRYGLRPAGEDPGGRKQLQLWVTQPLSSGEEITDVYGLKSNDDMLWEFGFTVPWIHNLTCLASLHLHVRAEELPDVGARARRRRRALSSGGGGGGGGLRFHLDGCLGSGFQSLVALARYFHADASDRVLQAECGLEQPPPWGTSASGLWHLASPCHALSARSERSAVELVKALLQARLLGMPGGSLEEEERLLAAGGLPQGARRDAVAVRHDERYVLQQAIAWLLSREKEAQRDAAREL